MRVLLVSDFYPPTLGGMERVVEDLAVSLLERGHDISVATLTLDGQSSSREQRGVPVHQLRALSTRALARSYDSDARRFHPTLPDPLLVREIRQLIRRERPQVVHANGWIMHSCVPAVRGLSAKLIVTLHDYGLACPKKTYLREGSICDGPGFPKCVMCAAEQYGGAKAAALTVGIELSQRTIYGAVDTYIAISGSVSAVSRKRLPDNVTIEVIPSFLAKMPARAQAPQFVPCQDGYLMYAGALENYKGLDVLLDAYERSSTATPLLLVGPRRTQSLSLPRGVTVAYDVPHAEVLAAWGHCSAALVPSIWAEPFGLVALEAMAAGRPVIASRVGGLAEIVLDGETGLLVPPGDSAALAGAVERLLADPALAATYGNNGRARSTNFTAAAVVPRIEALYARVSGDSVDSSAAVLAGAPTTNSGGA